MVPMEIKRLICNDLRREFTEPEVLVLVGPRQVGKTTLMRWLEGEARAVSKRTRFLDLEQPADLAALGGGEEDVLAALTTAVDVTFVDEFYYLENAGHLFKAVFDRVEAGGRPVKIVASGSSSIAIHSHLKESLAGRMIRYRVFPLTLDEYRGWESDRRWDLDDYLRFGGLPGLSGVDRESRRQRLLQDYLSTYLIKDVKSLVREENVRAFNQLLYILAQNQGQLVEASSLSREIGVSAPTVSAYLDIMDQTFVNFLVPSYHTNLANELKKSRKTYLYDLGIRNSILRDFRHHAQRDDRGAIFESFVFLTLRARLEPNMEIRFWRTKKKVEVDFVLVVDRQPFPIEVKAGTGGTRPPGGVLEFCRRYPKVKQTFTVTPVGHEPFHLDGVTHHQLAFEETERILDFVGGDG